MRPYAYFTEYTVQISLKTSDDFIDVEFKEFQ